MTKLVSPISLFMRSAKEVLIEERKKIGNNNEENKEIIGQIKLFNGAIKTTEKIEKAVNGYSNSWNIFYRIWNAVKACFGMSDWQCAKRSLLQLKNESAKWFAPAIQEVFGLDPIDSKDKKITSLFNFVFSKSSENKVLSSLADAALYAMIGINNNKAIKYNVNLKLNPKLDEKEKEEIACKLKKEPSINKMIEDDFINNFTEKAKNALNCFKEK